MTTERKRERGDRAKIRILRMVLIKNVLRNLKEHLTMLIFIFYFFFFDSDNYVSFADDRVTHNLFNNLKNVILPYSYKMYAKKKCICEINYYTPNNKNELNLRNSSIDSTRRYSTSFNRVRSTLNPAQHILCTRSIIPPPPYHDPRKQRSSNILSSRQ